MPARACDQAWLLTHHDRLCLVASLGFQKNSTVVVQYSSVVCDMLLLLCCMLWRLCAGHDPNDYEIGKRVGLPTINIMNKDGSLNAAAGE